MEAALHESRRAYLQLDDTYKGLVEKAQADKGSAIKQCERSYQVKIKSKMIVSSMYTCSPGGDCPSL